MSIIDTLNDHFLRLEAEDRFSGVVLITQGRSTLYQGAFGYASRAWQVKNSLDVRFDTASITKLFTAVAVLQLIDEQRLALDTRALDCLGLAGTAISGDVTVYHLLTHTSGIGDDADEARKLPIAEIPRCGAHQSEVCHFTTQVALPVQLVVVFVVARH